MNYLVVLAGILSFTSQMSLALPVIAVTGDEVPAPAAEQEDDRLNRPLEISPESLPVMQQEEPVALDASPSFPIYLAVVPAIALSLLSMAIMYMVCHCNSKRNGKVFTEEKELKTDHLAAVAAAALAQTHSKKCAQPHCWNCHINNLS